MSAHLFLWNPKRWEWKDLAEAIRTTASGGVYKDRWSCGVTKNIEIGSRAFLMRVGRDRPGILASGTVASEPDYFKHFEKSKADAGEEYLCVKCDWHRILDPDCRLPLAFLKNAISDQYTWTPRASGVRIPAEISRKLELSWAQHTGFFSLPLLDAGDELQYLEGEKRSALIEYRQRERKLRDKNRRRSQIQCWAIEM